MTSGQGYRTPNQPEKGGIATYNAGSRWEFFAEDARATILGNRGEPSGESRRIGQTKNRNAGRPKRYTKAPIERLRKLLNDVPWHRDIDFAGKLDEARRKVIFAPLPGKIE